ncbi:hypothetical protein Tco_0064559 [Tanacetum coccineum]
MRFDDSFKTDMDMMVELMNALIKVVKDKLMNNVEWDELMHTEMVKTVVESEDLDLDCVHAEDGLHLHGVRVVQDMYEADQNVYIINQLSESQIILVKCFPLNMSNVYDVQALRLAMIGNVLTNESRILAREFSNLKDEDMEGSQVVKDLRSESARLLEEFVMLRYVPRSSEDSQKSLAKEVDRLRPSVEKALNDVRDLGDSLDLKDIADYDPHAQKNFDEDGKAFSKVEFPYISMLVERVGQSLGELADMPIQFLIPDVILAFGNGPTMSMPYCMNGHAAVSEGMDNPCRSWDITVWWHSLRRATSMYRGMGVNETLDEKSISPYLYISLKTWASMSLRHASIGVHTPMNRIRASDVLLKLQQNQGVVSP